MARMVGADVDQLRALARRFTASADKLQHSSNGLSSAVTNAAFWRGNDAERFRTQWRSHSNPLIVAVVKALHSAADALIRNADEQDQASAAGGGSTGGTTSGTGGTSAPGAAGGHSAAQGGSNSGGGQAPTPSKGASGVTEPQSGGRDAYLKQVGAADNHPDGMGAFAGQCTSWAAFRRKELGLPWPHPTGNGGEMAGKMGGTATTPPSLGAIVSDPAGGHVMIVEETYPDGSFRVSEMNVVPLGEQKNFNPVLGAMRTDRIWRPNADGTYTSDKAPGYLKSSPKRLVIAS